MEPSIGELFFSGVKLMFIGMGIVYLFLALLVWVIGFTAKLIHRWSPDPAAAFPPVFPSHHKVGDDEASDVEIVAAISAAIHHHQNN